MSITLNLNEVTETVMIIVLHFYHSTTDFDKNEVQ